MSNIIKKQLSIVPVDVFLGGTGGKYAKSTWRDTFIEQLNPGITYFNPIVAGEWTAEDQELELQHRGLARFVLYVISPLLAGLYSVAELIDDSNKRPDQTLFHFLEVDSAGRGAIKTWSEAASKSNKMVTRMAVENGARQFDSLPDIAEFLNNQ